MFVIVFAITVPFTVFADVTSYTSGFQLQNLDAVNSATINITFVRQDGTTEASVADTIAANGSKTYFPLGAVSAGFNGSAVISSSTEVTALANVLGNDGLYGASYSGFSEGATLVNIPLIMKNNFGISTWFNVQNLGTSDATVNVSYKPGTCTEQKVIKPNASQTFDQSSNSCLTSGFVGAASVNGGSNSIAVTVMQVTGSTSGLKPSLLAYNGFIDSATNPVMPLVSSGFYGSGTGIQIQNTGTVNTNVTLTYTPSAGFPGATCTETKSVTAGASTTFSFPSLPAGCYTNGGAGGANSFVGSARVTGNSASQPLVGIVNQVTVGQYNAAAYGAFNSSNATNRVSLPLIMDRNYGIFTGFSIMNVGSSSTTVNCTFSNTTYTASATLAAGASLTDVQLNRIAAGYVGSAVCTATGGDQKIVGVVNELNQGTIIPTQDGLLTFEGVNY
jgi:hypothetical protein